jgi:hypothetical protein
MTSKAIRTKDSRKQLGLGIIVSLPLHPSLLHLSAIPSSSSFKRNKHGRSTTACQSGRPHRRTLGTFKRQTHQSYKEDLGLWCHRCIAYTGWNIAAKLRIELFCHFIIFDLGLATLVLEARCCGFLAGTFCSCFTPLPLQATHH